MASDRQQMRVLIDADRIRQRVAELGRQIKNDYGEQPLTIVGVLTGSLIFLADLVRHLDLPLRIALIQASSYRGATTTPGDLRVHADQMPDLRGRHVLILDDILDTGATLASLAQQIHGLGTASLRIAVLLRKHGRQTVPVAADYCGFDIPDEFVVGYGLDYNDEYRNLPHVAVLPSTSAALETLGSP
jgi:hypoxanthine phosphoribosyltransferase